MVIESWREMSYSKAFVPIHNTTHTYIEVEAPTTLMNPNPYGQSRGRRVEIGRSARTTLLVPIPKKGPRELGGERCIYLARPGRFACIFQ